MLYKELNYPTKAPLSKLKRFWLPQFQNSSSVYDWSKDGELNNSISLLQSSTGIHILDILDKL